MKLKPRTLAMILAGGRVDDLTVLTFHRPKSAVPFGGFSRVIDFPLSNLMNSGLDRVAILSQYRSYSLINHTGIGEAWDMTGRYRGISILPPYLGYGNSRWYRGSSDAVYQNLDFVEYIDPEQLLILSGDHIYHMDYREIINYHREKDADLTMACIKYNWASLTVFCFKPDVLYSILKANIKNDASYEFGRDIIPRMMNEKRRVYGFKFKGYWGYTRTIEEYWQTNMDLLGPDPKIKFAEWGIRTNLEHRGIRDCQPLKIGEYGQITDSLIYNGCVVEGEVERSILFPGTRVEKGAKVKDSVLFFNNVVSREAILEKVVSDVNTTFGRGVRIGTEGKPGSREAAVIGWNNFIKADTIIGSGATVYPGIPSEKIPKQVESGEVIR
jgi:glucose-1-phosphate adenylyltransferase